MKKPSPQVTFTLSIEEANKIFKALGNLPFTEVYELIGKLNEQANRQLSGNEEQSNPPSFFQDASMNIDQRNNN